MNLNNYKELVTQALQELGYNPEEALVNGEEFHWVIKKGSAGVGIELFELETDKRPFILVYSYIMKIPPNRLPELFAELLMLNATMVVASFIIEGDKILLKADRDLIGADKDELKYIIEKVSFYADKLDDYLIDKYSDKVVKKS